MPRKPYQWDDSTPPTIAAHSRRKHEILRSYIREYLVRYASNPTTSQLNLAIVDGFCGGGEYRSESDNSIVHGSPFHILDGLREGECTANKQRAGKGIRSTFTCIPQLFFIDRDPNAINLLQRKFARSEEFEPPQHYTIRFLCTEFNEAAKSLIGRVQTMSKGGRSIWFLDQYGYSQVRFPLIRQILRSLPEAEVIFTYAIDMQATYLTERNLRAFAKNTQIASTEYEADEFLASILDCPTAQEQRLAIERRIFEVYRNLGARYITPFAIHSDASHKSYWLIHLANHFRANEVMKQIHWSKANDFAHFGAPGLNMLGYKSKDDQNVTGQLSLDGSEFQFDEVARSNSFEALLEELPTVIGNLPDRAIKFQDLVSEHTNETPASLEIFKDAVSRLRMEGEVEIRGSKGERRRSAPTGPNDSIHLPRQRDFFKRH